jgi:hypothetical protein
VPDKLHTSAFQVGSVDAASLGLDATGDAVLCKGDAGAPAVRGTGATAELVAVNVASWQGGCLGTDESETRTGAVDARLDDLNAWIQQVRSRPQKADAVAGDFNGDGKSDVAALYDYGKGPEGRNAVGLWVFDSDGHQLLPPQVAWESSGSWTWSAVKLTSGDFNGDGRTDIAALYNYGESADGVNQTKLWVFTSTGDGFSDPKVVWDSQSAGGGSWTWASSKLTSGDFNGDGKADVGVLYDYGQSAGVNHTGLWSFTSTGSAFQQPVKVWDSGTGSWDWDAGKVTSGDFDGDGRTDVAVLYDYGQATDGRSQTGLWLFRGAAGLTMPKKVWTSDISWDWDRSTPTAGDYDGDGKADLAVLYNDGVASDGRNQTGLWTLPGTATGVGAEKKIWQSTGSWSWSLSQPVSGDFGADGKADLEVLYDYGKTADGRYRTGLWSFASTGATMTAPHLDWDSALQ